MMRYRNFLIVAMLLALTSGHASASTFIRDSFRKSPASRAAEAVKDQGFFCSQVRAYSAGHSAKEGRAYAAANNIPEWIVKKAEACLK